MMSGGHLMRRIYIPILLSIFLWTGVLQAQTIKIATDQNMWYPYSYEENGVVKGYHIDIVTAALKKLGYTFTLTPLPWKRCLMLAKRGEVDAIISASYQPKRAKYLYYPLDAASAKESNYRITQVTYSIVTYIDNPYTFNGDLKTLPKPVRVPRGYSVIDDLKKENVWVDEGPSDVNNFKKLLRDKKGCIVTLPEIVDKLMKDPAFRGKVKVSKKPFKSKSYFFVFSKKGVVSIADREKIWEEIKKVRDNDKLMEKLLEKYLNSSSHF